MILSVYIYFRLFLGPAIPVLWADSVAVLHDFAVILNWWTAQKQDCISKIVDLVRKFIAEVTTVITNWQQLWFKYVSLTTK